MNAIIRSPNPLADHEATTTSGDFLAIPRGLNKKWLVRPVRLVRLVRLASRTSVKTFLDLIRTLSSDIYTYTATGGDTNIILPATGGDAIMFNV